MSRIFLVRHVPTAENARSVFQGQRDAPPLVVDDRECYALPSARRTIYTSPLQRAEAAVSLLFPGEHAIPDDRLLERSVGKWEGLHHEEVQARWPGTFVSNGSLDPLREPPGGETLQEFAGRVEAFLVWLDDGHDAEAGDVYLVTHNGWIRVALWLAGHVPLSALFRESVPFLTPIDLAR